VLLKTDGLPTYNFANVVDDHLMRISHVVRGNEYLSSTPKYNLLYEAFGWEIPTYVHCAPIMKDEHNKLSKRNGDASFFDLIDKGYLPEAILNYICMLGWSPAGNEEFFTLSELEKAFTITGISKSPAIFDPEKLTWMNSEYIKRMDDERFTIMAKPYIVEKLGDLSDDKLAKICSLIKTRISTFRDISEMIDFFATLPEYSTELYIHKKMKTDEENSLVGLKIVKDAFDKDPDIKNNFTSAALYELFCKLAEQNELKNSQILWPVRTALSGLPTTPGGATDIAELLGYDESYRRIQKGIELLSK